MKSEVDIEIERLYNEISALQMVLDRFKAVRDRDAVAMANGDEPKVKRGRKKKAGLPSATPPASEANLAGRL